MVIGDQIEVADTLVTSIDEIKSEDKKQIEAEELEIIKDVDVIVEKESPKEEEKRDGVTETPTEGKQVKEKKHPKLTNLFRRLSGDGKKKELKKEISKDKVDEAVEVLENGEQEKCDAEEIPKLVKKEDKHPRVTNLFRRLSLDRRAKKHKEVEKKEKEKTKVEEIDEKGTEAVEHTDVDVIETKAGIEDENKSDEKLEVTGEERPGGASEDETKTELESPDKDSDEKPEVRQEKKFTLKFNSFFKKSKEVQSPTTPKDEDAAVTPSVEPQPSDSEAKLDEANADATDDMPEEKPDTSDHKPEDGAAPADPEDSQVKSPDSAPSRFHVKLPHLPSVFKKQSKTPVS